MDAEKKQMAVRVSYVLKGILYNEDNKIGSFAEAVSMLEKLEGEEYTVIEAFIYHTV